MSDAFIYRVFKLPESLLTAMREKRDEVKTTNVRFLADAVDRHLPGLVEDLQRLGFGVHGGDQQMARLPLSDESATPQPAQRGGCKGRIACDEAR